MERILRLGRQYQKIASENRYVLIIANNQARRTITYTQVDPFAM